MKLTLVALFLLISAVIGRADETYKLRGPGVEKGQTKVSKGTFKSKDGSIVIKVMGNAVTGKQSITTTTEEEVKVTAVVDGEPVKAQTKVVLEKTETTLKIMGQAKTEKKDGDLEGEVIVSERGKDGKWKHTLVDTKPTDKQKKDLERRVGPDTQAELYPEKGVSIGDTWDVDAAVLQRVLGGSITDLKGKMKMKLVKVEDYEGESCAVIEYTGSVTGIAKADDGDLDLKLDIKGNTWRSLKTGIDVKDSAEGKLKMTGKIKTDGLDADVELAGPFTIEGTTKLKAKKTD